MTLINTFHFFFSLNKGLWNYQTAKNQFYVIIIWIGKMLIGLKTIYLTY